MKRQLRNNGSESVILRGTTFKKLYLMVTTVGVIGDSWTEQDIDLTKIRIGLQLDQHGKQLSSSFNAVGPTALGVLKNKDVFGMDNINFYSDGLKCGGYKIQDEQPTVPYESILIIPILYKGMSLTGSDELLVNVDLLSGLFDSGNASDDSKVYLITEEGLDTEQLDLQLPVFFPLTTDKQSPAFNEDAISECAILSSYPASKKADFAINSVDVKSTHVNERYDQNTLFAKQIIDTYQFRDGMNVLIASAPASTMEKAEINLDVDTEKLHNGCEFLYVMRAKHNASLASKAIQHRNKVSARKALVRGLQVGKKW